MADRIEDAAIRFQDPFLELLLGTGEELRPDQRQEFVDVLMSKQEEFEEDRLARDDAEYREDLEDRFDKQLSRYLGSLTAEQTDRIACWRFGNDAIGSFLVGRSPGLDSGVVSDLVGG